MASSWSARREGSRGAKSSKSTPTEAKPNRACIVHYREECRIELAEAASSVFLPKRATMFFFDIGSVAKKDGRAGWVRSDMEAFRMKVGTIDYADWLFDLSSLPVPKDVQVSDHRKRREAR